MNCIFLRRGYGSNGGGLPPKGKALSDYTWKEISLIATAGAAAEYFSVGDRKEVKLNGTVGKLSLSNYTTYAYIIGINHNASVEGANRIHFMLGKTALTGGKDIALCDSSYGNTSGSTAFCMNTANSNSGGWKSSQMRTMVCGTSLTSYSGTIIGAIPTELRAVLSPVTKYTDNTGNGSSAASAVTATTDYFFLLSEYEIMGATSYANTNEASKQKQYDYYKNGGSVIKYKHNSTNTAAWWWLRSPRRQNSDSFLVMREEGYQQYDTAAYCNGFAPAFCVGGESSSGGGSGGGGVTDGYTITVTGTGDATNCYVMLPENHVSSAGTFTVAKGSTIACYAKSGRTYYTSYVILNGTYVAEGSQGAAASYTFAPSGDVTINLQYNASGGAVIQITT